jgi:hypothetical protein
MSKDFRQALAADPLPPDAPLKFLADALRHRKHSAGPRPHGFNDPRETA